MSPYLDKRSQSDIPSSVLYLICDSRQVKKSLIASAATMLRLKMAIGCIVQAQQTLRTSLLCDSLGSQDSDFVAYS